MQKLAERDVERDTRVIRRETRLRREAIVRTPFHIRPVRRADGVRFLVEPSGGVDLYFAPRTPSNPTLDFIADPEGES